MEKAIAYIDAFNFYYGLTKDTNYKWCDLYTLCTKLAPKHQIEKIKLFTATSKQFDDPKQPIRQDTYLRALEENGNVEIHRSKFCISQKELPLVDGTGKVFVKVTQEKGADVNLATQLLLDAYYDKYDLAMVLSNDSDLEQPVRAVRKDFNKKIRIFSPVRYPNRKMSHRLMVAAGGNNHEIISFDLVKQCQLPNPVNSSEGKQFFMPSSW